jgi:hypothetical protein
MPVVTANLSNCAQGSWLLTAVLVALIAPCRLMPFKLQQWQAALQAAQSGFRHGKVAFVMQD